jgi:dienelactone hydrolase
MRLLLPLSAATLSLVEAARARRKAKEELKTPPPLSEHPLIPVLIVGLYVFAFALVIFVYWRRHRRRHRLDTRQWQKSIPLWPGKAHPCMTVTIPVPLAQKGSMHIYPAMVVFRGGGWKSCASSGLGFAEWAATKGMVGVEVEYAAKQGAQPLSGEWLPEGSVLGPLPDGESPYPQCLHDAARSIRLLRKMALAGELPIDPERVCACGFSAGGWLAAMLATRWADSRMLSTYADELGEQISCGPDRVALCYPVTSLLEASDPPAMHDAYELLLGDRASDASLREQLSPKLHAGPNTPPLFLWHTVGDQTVPCSHSMDMFSAARKAGVQAELHLYAGEGRAGRHAQGLALDNKALCGWSTQLLAWLGPEWLDQQ